MKLIDYFDKLEIIFVCDWGVFDIYEMIFICDLGCVCNDIVF